ncbi:MAG: UDP-N-acetylenolpyruvoylglucosamine reductase [Candidatus Daviesbacteria bacterium GW2011_GWA1_41_61]|uniref:UDP-N-acetylenolpyruvoylglucosamine reductase n=1 Tax=Candidatus Daviesbacteria bacterium GW2011_GWA2_40_9 TaxID=1618424 RepID=A0A0G0U6Z2_9BACT|nr:MAG: UDP-N-acetylenolpyruvoylglucosamine reductase [Candidatus Daviesbacteria bacterium GW2011_GWC1_40_9]KKR82981.1 MAG: UDP-N-acetylenolpyruvoylglucosamine reductase [Candidatus Daviesbacteria bacterium GW2011_GWA2_40_9]KKR92907.1 MAG: UDP-N-acetylenolpyruvoylglucosamine reductase [Candidatus Daviesbacteria bacterium GW2011_GWB1_41_15]KKS15451.1 MAG: UDP-N-acetylenolpyruvoylglucosamine reductase [Candidatus Daviesbacteria bacterium GW2011_GWA1_41_61]
MHDRLKILQDYLGGSRVKRDCDISEHLVSGFGGTASAFYIATTVEELIKIVQLCRELKLDFLIIGSGSKIAISKEGINSLVIKNRSDNLKIFGVKGNVSRQGIGIEEALVEAESGTSLKRLAEFALEHRLGGLEIFQNTLGTVGGSLYILPIVREKAHQVKVLTSSGEVEVKDPYLVSKEDVIISAVFKLKAQEK